MLRWEAPDQRRRNGGRLSHVADEAGLSARRETFLLSTVDVLKPQDLNKNGELDDGKPSWRCRGALEPRISGEFGHCEAGWCVPRPDDACGRLLTSRCRLDSQLPDIRASETFVTPAEPTGDDAW